MWSSELFHDSLQLFVGLGKVIGQVFHICSQLLNFGINLVDQLTCFVDAGLKCDGFFYDDIDIIIDHLLVLFPLFNFLHLYFSHLVVLRSFP